MNLSPRQLAAYLEFSNKLDRIEQANNLKIAATAAQGNGEAIETMLKGFEWHQD